MKKNLIILLIMPFIIALISFVSITGQFEAAYSDIQGFNWQFSGVDALAVKDGEVGIEVERNINQNVKLAPGNDKIRYILSNKDEEDKNPIARLVVAGNYTPIEDDVSEILVEADQKVYIKPLRKGEVILRIENEKGNIFKQTDLILYTNGLIMFSPVIELSQNNIDPNLYYGLYDYDQDLQKVEATIDFELRVLPESLLSEIIPDVSSNLKLNIDFNNYRTEGKFSVVNFSVNPKKAGDALISFKTDDTYQVEEGEEEIDSREFSFKCVDGVNIYTYAELLKATNQSETGGEVIALRKSFVDLETYSNSTSNNVALYGNYDEKNGRFSFSEYSKNEGKYVPTSELYQFETTFNQEFITKWNEFVDAQIASGNNKFKKTGNTLLAALHVQKDLYGNGYSLNFHSATYASDVTEYEGIARPSLKDYDLYRGPLPFYCLGDPNNNPLIKVFGQDNCGIYINNDNVTVNDLVVSNCNQPASLVFYSTVGNVMDINADNVTIKNSRLQNGKNVLRAFSSNGLLVDNCLLSNCQNFLIVTGANEYKKNNKLLENSFKAGGYYDNIMNQYLSGDFTDKEDMAKKLDEIQSLLNEENAVKGDYKGSMTINDTYFSQSGLACICFESLFNGPFLYQGSPSMVLQLFETHPNYAPLLALDVSGVSYPVTVSVTGDTKFYDYKDVDKIDLSGLIEEHISDLISSKFNGMTLSELLVQYGFPAYSQIIDMVFPLKDALIASAEARNCIYKTTDEEGNITRYATLPVCYYGGGLNLSSANQISGTQTLTVEFANKYLSLGQIDGLSGDLTALMGVALKGVVVATGFKPFRFTLGVGNGYLFGETPNIRNLENHLKIRS